MIAKIQDHYIGSRGVRERLAIQSYRRRALKGETFAENFLIVK